MWHHTPDGGIFNFINTTALTYDWHNVTVDNHDLNLVVRRLQDGRIHARTQGFREMACKAGHCDPETSSSKRGIFGKLRPRAVQSNVEDIDVSWTEPAGFGTKPQSGLKDAADGVAAYVATANQGTTGFCSRVLSENGLDAAVGFNFYGDGYATNFPPPCEP